MELKNISQSKLAKDSGVSQAQISRLLSGEQHPGLLTLTKLATALGVTIPELLGESAG